MLGFCDSACREWVDHQCAGLSKATFQSVFQSVILLPLLYYLQSAEVASLKKSLKTLSAEMAELRVLVLLAHDKASQSENSSAIALPTPESQSTTAAPQLIHLPAATSCMVLQFSLWRFNVVIVFIWYCEDI